MEALRDKQAKERQELVKQQMALKKTIANAPKKEKKVIKQQIDDMELDLKRVHQEQLLQLEMQSVCIDGGIDTPSESKDAADVLPLENDPTLETDASASEMPVSGKGIYVSHGKGPSRQQKRKAKKQQEMEALRKEAELEAANMPDLRKQETQEIDAMLSRESLSIWQVPADGNCLYLSVLDQTKDFSSQMELRKAVSAHIRQNQDDFVPFLAESLDVYLEALENKAAWGGHVEILALSQILHRDIQIWKADGPLIVGENATAPCDLIKVSYHRHSFGLGEHYNAIRTI